MTNCDYSGYTPVTRKEKNAIIRKNLKLCRNVVQFLKQNPETAMLLKTFPYQNVGFSSVNSQCPGGGVGSAIAHCHMFNCKSRYPVARICIKQKALAAPFMLSTRGRVDYSAPKKIVEKVLSQRVALVQKNPLLKRDSYGSWKCGGVPYSGTWALVDIMLHELAHHVSQDKSTRGGHGPWFYVAYMKLHEVFVDAVRNRDPNIPNELVLALGKQYQ